MENELLKIYTVEFEPFYPVGCCLVLAAYNMNQATNIARTTIGHTDKFTVKEIIIDIPKVIEYLSGDY
jgi:hypothetical protein